MSQRIHPLTQRHTLDYLASVAVNPATGIGLPNTQADSRHAAFFSSVVTRFARLLMAGECGAAFGLAGSCVPVDQLRISPATPIGLGVAGSSAHTGDTQNV